MPSLCHSRQTESQETMSDYVASPPTTDTAARLREAQIRIRHLRELLTQSDQEIAKREHTIQDLYLDRE